MNELQSIREAYSEIKETQITRLSNTNKESDVFMYTLDLLEKDKSLITRIIQIAIDLVVQGKYKTAVQSIVSLTTGFTKKHIEDIRKYVLTNIDSMMLVNDPKFINTIGLIIATGLIYDLRDYPNNWVGYMKEYQRTEVETMQVARGKKKFVDMLKNANLK